MSRKVCVAGTFNRIHKGHIALLARAFEEGGEVFVGLTSDEMARQGRGVVISDYASRERALREALLTLANGKDFHILMIEDRLGPAAVGDYDAIIVSSETRATALEINEARQKEGLRPLDIIEIGMVLAEDGVPISSTRVMSGIIKSDGLGKP